MPELKHLYLDYNGLTRTIPPRIWSLRKLQKLIVSNNKLTGDVVVDGFAAMSLTIIDVASNVLSGVIREVFGHLENLTDLLL
ncbi:hypothetical protein C2845_PM13G03400 [Panicum miliaceum]|uniref:Uncharacterized protein n=1 Tax=Panicum miliaceum TaxID=4540 RepID=A0A3L6RG24_PANMI|nr:hypothetical protein C2845_PM13G03400 [Panicum miliaceum]